MTMAYPKVMILFLGPKKLKHEKVNPYFSCTSPLPPSIKPSLPVSYHAKLYSLLKQNAFANKSIDLNEPGKNGHLGRMCKTSFFK